MLQKFAIIIPALFLAACGGDQGNTRTTYMGPTGGENNGKKLPETQQSGSGTSGGGTTNPSGNTGTPGGSGSNVPFSQLTFASGDLTGTWQGHCDKAAITIFEFVNNNLNITTSIYGENSCSQKDAEIKTVSTYTDGPAHGSGWELDILFVSHKMVMLSQLAATYANNDKLCGFDNWVENVEKSIPPGSCDEVTTDTKDQTIYGISSSGSLYIGSGVGAAGWSVSGSRPSDLVDAEYQKK